jgi:hypothetical protein
MAKIWNNCWALLLVSALSFQAIILEHSFQNTATISPRELKFGVASET